MHRCTCGGGASYDWRLSDGLGSVDALVDGAPAGGTFRLMQRMSFDAFGQRRDAYGGTWETTPPTGTLGGTESNVTLRGYTGHEQVDPVGMIHMNGRLYDPRIGRFVQADPVVDDGLDGQAYNRYSYVTNNPLRYTDPSGYRRSGHARSAGVALLSLIVFNVAAPAAMPGWLWSALQGATVGAVGTGSSSGAAWGAVSGLTFHGIGALKLGPDVGTPFAKVVSDGGYWAKVSLHAAAGGTLNELQGGDFGHGFVTAGVSAGVSPLIDTIGDGRANARPARIVVQALVGGAVSKGIGGDFGSGALLAAIGRVMNAESGLISAERRERASRILSSLVPTSLGELQFRIEYDSSNLMEIALALDKLSREQGGSGIALDPDFGHEAAMLARVVAGYGDKFTAAWFWHEQNEAALLRDFQGLSGDAYLAKQIEAHHATQRAQGTTEFDYYHPQVVRSFPEQFSGPRYERLRHTWDYDFK